MRRERGWPTRDIGWAFGWAFGGGRALDGGGEATPPGHRRGVSGPSLDGLGLHRLGLHRLGLRRLGLRRLGLHGLGLHRLGLCRLGLHRLEPRRRGQQRLLGGEVARTGWRGLRRGGGCRGPGRDGGYRRLPWRNLGLRLPGRDVYSRRLRPGQLGLGRSLLAEQLVPLDERANTQGQQGYAAHADRDVDQHQLASDNPGDQQSERDGNQKRAEPDHGRSPSDPCRSSAPTGARARALPQWCGSHRNGARPQAHRTDRDPARHYARPLVRSARLASGAANRRRRSGNHRFP